MDFRTNRERRDLRHRPKNERLREAVDRSVGATAAGCRECRKTGRNKYGYDTCSQWVNESGQPECAYPVPALTGDSAIAFYLFIRLQTQWQHAGMAAMRVGIPRHELEIEADIRGIELTEPILDKFGFCELEVRRYDADKAETERLTAETTQSNG